MLGGDNEAHRFFLLPSSCMISAQSCFSALEKPLRYQSMPCKPCVWSSCAAQGGRRTAGLAPHAAHRLRLAQVQVHGACLGDAASACLIMELVPGGNLAERIYNPHKRRMSHLEILQVGLCAWFRPGLSLGSGSGFGTGAELSVRDISRKDMGSYH